MSAHALPTHCCTMSLCWMPISIWYLVGTTAVDHRHIVLSFHEMLTLLTIREHLDFVVTPVVQCCNAPFFPPRPCPSLPYVYIALLTFVFSFDGDTAVAERPSSSSPLGAPQSNKVGSLLRNLAMW